MNKTTKAGLKRFGMAVLVTVVGVVVGGLATGAVSLKGLLARAKSVLPSKQA